MSSFRLSQAFQSSPEVAHKSQGMTVHSLIASLASSAAVFLLEITVFLLLRNRRPGLYRPRSMLGQNDTEPASLELNTIDWIWLTFTSSESTILEECGHDAFFFIRFLQLVLKLFAPAALVILPILIPLNMAHSGRTADINVEGLDNFSWSGIDSAHTRYYWVHLVLALLFIGYFGYLVQAEFSMYTQHRQHHLPDSKSSAIVLITDIPRRYMSVKALSTMYGNVTGGVEHVWLNRDYTSLYEKIVQRQELRDRLEVAETKLISNALKANAKRQKATDGSADGAQQETAQEEGGLWSKYVCGKDRETMSLPTFKWFPWLHCLGRKVDTIDHCRREIAQLTQDIREGQANEDQYKLSTSALVQFRRAIDAHVICQSLPFHLPFRFVPHKMPAAADSVVWERFKLVWWERQVRSGLFQASAMILILGWAVPVASTGFLSQISYLLTVWPWLRGVPTWSLAIIQGVLPQMTLLILTSLLPGLITSLVQRRGFSQVSAATLSVQRLYFCFLFVQVFLTVALSSSVTTMLVQIYQGLDSVLAVLARNLPKSSNYFLSYLLLQAFSISAGKLVQISGLLQHCLLSPICDVSPRQKYIRQLNVRRLDWAIVFPVYCNLACIGIIYSIIAPIIIAFVLFAFGLFWMAFRYNLLFVILPSHDTGGLLYATALNQLFTGIYVLEVCLLGLFSLTRNEDQGCACIGQAVMMLFALVFTVGFQCHLNTALDALSHYSPIVREDRVESPKHKMPRRGCGHIARLLRWHESPTGSVLSHQRLADSNMVDMLERLPLNVRIPTIWIPKDSLGISEDEIARASAKRDLVQMTNANAWMDPAGNIHLDGAPPAT